MRSNLSKIRYVILFVFGNLFAMECQARQDPIVIKSPNGGIHAILNWGNEDILTYCVLNINDTLVSFSEMRITVNGVNLGAGVEFVNRIDSVIDETIPTLWNKSEIRNHCNYSRIKFLNKPAALQFWVELKSFDNGIAFRYVIPGETKRTVVSENKAFKIAGENQFYYASGPFQYGWLQEY